MNYVLRLAIIIWLLMCILVSWIGCAVVGFIFSFSPYSFMYNVTPFVGYTCLIVCAIGIRATYHSNPYDYLTSTLGGLYGR